MFKSVRIVTCIVCVAVTVGCAGRSPQLVAVAQPQDNVTTCEQIIAEVEINNQKIEDLAREQGWKTTQNVVAGVAGLAIPILWFGMDWQGTAKKEAQALSQRNQYLGTLAQSRCAGQRPVRRTT